MSEDSLPRRFGSYVLLGQRGRGGMGSVYLARPVARPADPERELVVIKLLHPSLLGDAESLQRFRHEAMIAVSVSSPEVVRVFDVGRVGDVPYIAMEHIAGWSAGEIARASLEASQPLPAPLVIAWLCDALAGLEALHTAVHPDTGQPLGVVHRDISPRNLLIDQDLRLRVIDFGLGTSNVQDWATRADVLLGTPGYMAPEQVEGRRLDARTDLYAVMVVGFELLTLDHYVTRGERAAMIQELMAPRQRPIGRPDVPAGLERVFRRALSPEPDARLGSAAELREALLPFAAEDSGRDPRALPAALRGVVEVEVTEPAAALLEAPAEPTVVFAARAFDDETPGIGAGAGEGRRRGGSRARGATRVRAPDEGEEEAATRVREREDVTRVRGGEDATRVRAGEDATRVLTPSSAGRDGSGPRGPTVPPTVVRGPPTGRGETVPPTLIRSDPSARIEARSGTARGSLTAAGLLLTGAVGAAIWLAAGSAPDTRPHAVGVSGAPSTSPVATARAAEPAAIVAVASSSRAAEGPVARAPAPSASPSPGGTTSANPSPVSTAPAPAPPSATPTRAARPTPVERTPRPSPTPPAAAPEPTEAILARLIARASAARARHPERQREIDEILTDASLWSRADDPARARVMLVTLEARLTALDPR